MREAERLPLLALGSKCEIAQSPVTQGVYPRMNHQLLGTCSRVPDDGRFGDVPRLGQHVQLAQPVFSLRDR